VQGTGAAIAAAPAAPVSAEAAAAEFWERRPDGVVAVRVGFAEEGDAIGEELFIAASAPANLLAAAEAAGPARYQGFEVRYYAADVAELADSMPGLEAQSISYDDEARTGEGFSFDRVEEDMTVQAHVGPEYSWDVLKGFLDGANQSLVSAMYEFHAKHVAGALEKRLAANVELQLVLDNATFTEPDDHDLEFERARTFQDWQRRFGSRFNRVVAPEGAHGLIANSYHIKVTVREDDTFWLSSGNWKMGSSQPEISQAQRDNASAQDLPGNREWHVVVRSPTLGRRFRNHIAQDFKRSRALGGGVLPRGREAPDMLVDVPEAPALERRPPSALLQPTTFTGVRKVKPLLTPDRDGAVYSRAVLELIRSARRSLLFQIPYIGMPSNPRADRGFIDELIEALTQKLKTLPDARVLLRVGGREYSSPAHAAWYFKSKGVRIQERLRRIENHHTKGMIVDRRRVLIGSHNWSQSGVTLNRDASLVFDDAEIADYYARAFEIDWQRSSPIAPKRHTKREAVMEAVGAAPPPGYRRVALSQLLKEDD
jgi:phosphatidylserine/phosphatidylglycerophosphate/cardiolipin synthase-like enzyme